MTDIEQKALALVNEVQRERGLPSFERYSRTFYTEEALYRAIEAHEAFRQQVSDALVNYFGEHLVAEDGGDALARFIIAKPDPLVEAVIDVWPASCNEHVNELRAAIEKRGGKIVWGEG